MMRPVGEVESAYVVTDVAYDVSAGTDSLHVRRIRPLPPAESEPRPSNDLEDVSLDELSTARDGLAQLAARAAPKVLGIWTAFNSRTEFKEYQFRPLLKYLKSPSRRILIADEVGLGKTIEAAYIIVEELASGLTKRILILCPAGLRLKWRDELWNRFGLHFQITNGKGLMQLLSGKGAFMAIVSYDSRWDEDEWKATRFPTLVDLLVVDEAHNLIARGGETQRRTMAFDVSSISAAGVTLTATPIHLEIDDLRRILEVSLGKTIDRAAFVRDSRKARLVNGLVADLETESSVSPADIDEVRPLLEEVRSEVAVAALQRLKTGSLDHDGKASLALEIGRANPFEALMIRTRKVDVGSLIPRHICNHSIPLDENARPEPKPGQESGTSEKSLYVEIDRLLEQSFSHVHRLQLSSCLPAMVDLLKDGMKGFDVWQREDRFESELSVMDQGNEEDFRRVEGRLPPQVRERCADLADRFGLVRTDSKLTCLRSLLEPLRERRTDGKPHKAIVFTQWRHTWAYLMRRLERLEGIRPFALSGDDDPRKVGSILREFEVHDGPALLISTDFLSEGLDLQAADVLVNYDFPYNPQRVEQRIGRIDRIGQRAPEITVHNMVVSGSLDEEILDVLGKRLDIFREGMSDAPALFETRAGTISETESRIFQRRLSASEKECRSRSPLKGSKTSSTKRPDESARQGRGTWADSAGPWWSACSLSSQAGGGG